MAHVLRTALTKLTGSATEDADKKENASPNTSESGPNSLTQATESKDNVEEKVNSSSPSAANDNDAALEKSEGNGEEKTPEVTAGEAEAAPDQSDNYLTGTRLASLTFGLALATFVVALDNTIIATAIPRITTQFDSLNDVGWYGSAYLLTTCSFQPSFGKVYTYFDVKWVYLSALMIFELGSILCAAATGSKMLIVGRAVAGTGAAALFSGGMTIVGYSVPLRRRAIYIAALSSMFGIASVVGPILGGALTDKVSWRWCFWINLPFGAVALAAVFFFFSNPARPHAEMTVKEKLKQIDFLGAFFLITSIICLLLALQWGGSVYPWHDSRVWGCLLGFSLLVSIFIGIQFWAKDRATMPPRILLGQRTVGACALFSSFLAMGIYTHIYYLPFYFQAVKGTTAEESGIRCIPYLVSITLSSIVIGAFITGFGPYNPPMWLGVIIFTVGAGMLHTLKVNSSEGVWIGYQILAGAGAGACVQIPFIAVQVVLDEKDMPIGNAVAIFFNTLGGAISVSVAQNIFSNTLVKQLPIEAPTVDPLRIAQAGATHLRDVTTPRQLPGVLVAFDKAVTTAFILPIAAGGLAALSSLLMEWKSVKGKSLIPGGA